LIVENNNWFIAKIYFFLTPGPTLFFFISKSLLAYALNYICYRPKFFSGCYFFYLGHLTVLPVRLFCPVLWWPPIPMTISSTIIPLPRTGRVGFSGVVSPPLHSQVTLGCSWTHPLSQASSSFWRKSEQCKKISRASRWQLPPSATRRKSALLYLLHPAHLNRHQLPCRCCRTPSPTGLLSRPSWGTVLSTPSPLPQLMQRPLLLTPETNLRQDFWLGFRRRWINTFHVPPPIKNTDVDLFSNHLVRCHAILHGTNSTPKIKHKPHTTKNAHLKEADCDGDILHSLYSAVVRLQHIPFARKMGKTNLIHKKSNLYQISNFQAITLLRCLQDSLWHPHHSPQPCCYQVRPALQLPGGLHTAGLSEHAFSQAALQQEVRRKRGFYHLAFLDLDVVSSYCSQRFGQAGAEQIRHWGDNWLVFLWVFTN